MGESALLSGGSAAVTQDTAGSLYVLPVGVFAFEKHTPNRHDPIFFSLGFAYRHLTQSGDKSEIDKTVERMKGSACTVAFRQHRRISKIFPPLQ